jgi:hypothetical protein
LELETWCLVIPMSLAMTSLSRGGNAYLLLESATVWGKLWRSGCTYQDQNANKKPNHEKKNTRP